MDKLTQAEKRVIEALKRDAGNFIDIGWGSHRVVTKDRKKVIIFFNSTLRSLRDKNIIDGTYPKLFLVNQQ